MTSGGKNFKLFMVGNASWFMSFGMQMVLFAWLVAIELNESPERVGLAQTALMLPVLLFSLIGGTVADRVGMRVIAAAGHYLAVPPIAVLAWITWSGNLRFEYLIVYALVMGVIQAFVSPSRDGMLAQVAGSNIQRGVIAVTGVQFGVQILGFALAGTADIVGAPVIILLQGLVILLGGIAFSLIRLPNAGRPVQNGERQSGAAMIRDGLSYVLKSPFLAPMLMINLAVGINFMGVFMVGIPLLMRDRFDATPADLAIVNIVNMVGVVAMILVLLRLGGVRRRGRAVLTALGAGALVIALLGLPLPYIGVMATIFVWGLCGGVAITIGRSIAQELAAPEYRARVMAIYTMALLGGAPAGSLIMGYLVRDFGVLNAMLGPAILMAVMVVMIGWRTRIWQLGPEHIEAR